MLNGLILEEKFNLTADFCNHIESHTNSSVYSDVEKEVRRGRRWLVMLMIACRW